MILIMLSSMDNAVLLQGCIKIKSGLHFPFHYFMDSDRLNLLLIIIGGSVNDWSVKIYLILLGPLRLCVCLINCVLRLSWDCFPIIGVVLTSLPAHPHFSSKHVFILVLLLFVKRIILISDEINFIIILTIFSCYFNNEIVITRGT